MADTTDKTSFCSTSDAVSLERRMSVMELLAVQQILPDDLTIQEFVSFIWDEYAAHCSDRGRVPHFSDLHPDATTGFARRVLVTNLIDGGDGN